MKEISNAHQGCVYLIKNTVKTVMFKILFFYIINTVTFDQFKCFFDEQNWFLFFILI